MRSALRKDGFMDLGKSRKFVQVNIIIQLISYHEYRSGGGLTEALEALRDKWNA